MQVLSQRSYTFGTWNVCGLSNKKREAFAEIKREEEDVVVLTETKLRGIGEEEYEGYIHLYSGISNGAPRAGVSILFKKGIVSSYQWKYQHERISRVDLNICGRSITVVGVYGVDECAKRDVKDDFQNHFQSVLNSVDSNQELVILGDFNSRVGTSADDPVLGPHGELEVNKNGRRLIELCKKHGLKIQNTFFKHEDKHKYTWYHPLQSRKTMIDFCITRQNSSLQVEDVVACRWLECGTDHIFLEATLYLQHHKEVEKDPSLQEDIPFELRKYRTYMLYSKSVQASYRDELENTCNLSDSQTTDEMYHFLKEKVHSAAFKILGLRKRDKVDEILCDQELRDLHTGRKERSHPLTEQVSSETNFTMNDEHYKTIKNDVWKGICSTINNTEEYRRNRVIWDIIKDLQSRTFRGKHCEYFNCITKCQKGKSKSEQYLPECFSDTNEPNLDNFLQVDITDVCNALEHLEDYNSPVPGGLEIILLRYSSNKVKMLLRNLIQNIFNGAKIPLEISEVYCTNSRINEEKCVPQHGEYSTNNILRIIRTVLKIMLEKCSSFVDIRRDIPNIPYLDIAFTLRQIFQKRAGKQIPPFHLMFIDFKTAFFDIEFSKLFEKLTNDGFPRKLIAVLSSMYSMNTFRTFELSQNFKGFSSGNGLTYDSSLSCTLLKIYLKDAVKAWNEENLMNGVMIGHKKLLSLYLGDCKLVVISNNTENMQTVIKSLKKHLENKDVELNLKYLKYLGIGNLEIDKEIIAGKEIINFDDLTLELDGGNSEEIFQHISDTKKAIGILHPVARDKIISTKNKKRIFHSIIRNLLLYGCETWTIVESLKRSLEDVELRYWRWCCESYPQRYSKKEVYDLMGVEEGISHMIMLKKAAWYTSILQIEKVFLPRNVLDWEPKGKLKCGRPKKKWVDGIEEFLKKHLQPSSLI